MAGSRLRRAASFTPPSLVTPASLEVIEGTPDVTRTLVELPAGSAASHGLAVATGRRPFPAMPSSPAPQRRQDAHLGSCPNLEIAPCRIGHEPPEFACGPPSFLVTVTHPHRPRCPICRCSGRGEGPARRRRPARRSVTVLRGCPPDRRDLDGGRVRRRDRRPADRVVPDGTTGGRRRSRPRRIRRTAPRRRGDAWTAASNGSQARYERRRTPPGAATGRTRPGPRFPGPLPGWTGPRALPPGRRSG